MRGMRGGGVCGGPIAAKSFKNLNLGTRVCMGTLTNHHNFLHTPFNPLTIQQKSHLSLSKSLRPKPP